MSTAIKFCGITRPADARTAGELGAAYVGAILTDSPRRVSPHTARDIYAAAGIGVRSVAVFREEGVDEIIGAAYAAGASIVQLHRPLTADDVIRLRRGFSGEIWTVVDVSRGEESKQRAEDARLGDGVLIDGSVGGKSGGTGIPLDWPSLSPLAARIRSGRLLILAGGLTPSNVSSAITSLEPDVVDVSSGVESAPGIKDHGLMARFTDAVRSAPLAHR